ncbi:glycoside hydrolase family 2 sugar binding protein [Microbacterium mangrovi]|uniref:Glycoside hydrolase family 2 sugar binding protein n=1 Tax=Microbacterium mangrovi TaxID=1348253 RepID=A0A0B2A468_9MICO|nr:DUF2804 domain-containing protein [Microbacterium mangrovi]KHK96412.1 glycoside hydrolase family 2 sugar binding protein [Microbacterium mangrovi]
MTEDAARESDPTEHELTEDVSLTTPGGRLDPKSLGFARHPLVDTAGIPAGWGRNKRWEYWNVITPSHILALTVSSIDYAAVHEVWICDRASGRTWGADATVLPARGVELPPRLHAGPARARARKLTIDIEPEDAAGAVVRLRARIDTAWFDVRVTRPAGHECLAVVVPWNDRRFQYTVKDVALPASGSVTVDGVRHEFDAAWAVLDHGRGKWPYDIAWNWGAASGVTDGRTIGIQVGGRWTDGTGSTENGVVVDGVLHKISVPVAWEYDLADVLKPWRIHGGDLDAVFTPERLKHSDTNLAVVASRTDQCFGRWSGTFTPPGGTPLPFADLDGFAEDVHNRW